MAAKKVGRIYGPGEQPGQIVFITNQDAARAVGEFFYYEHAPTPGQNTKVLIRVVQSVPFKEIPVAYMANPDVDPKVLLNALGADATMTDVSKVEAQIIGFKHLNKGLLRPTTPPRAGIPLFEADSQLLTDILNKKKEGEPGALVMGTLRGRPDVKIIVDGAQILSTHASVLAATGSGKSYTVGVVVEEFERANNRAAVLIVDPHGEYQTLKEIADKEQFKAPPYEAKYKRLAPGEFKVKFSEMTFEDLASILPDMSDVSEGNLQRAFRIFKGLVNPLPAGITQPPQTIQGFLGLIDQMALAPSGTGNATMLQAGTAAALRWRLENSLEYSQIVNDDKQTYLKEILNPGQATVLDLAGIPAWEQQIGVSVLLDRIFKSRLRHKVGKKAGHEADALDFPVLIIVEEAHRFAPRDDKTRTSKILKTLLSEGRKFGTGCVIISQRPGKIDADVLSQCLSQFFLRINNPTDQQFARDSSEGFTADMTGILPTLNPGEALLSGPMVATPVIVDVRERFTKHGGATEDPMKGVRDAWDKQNMDGAKSEAKPPVRQAAPRAMR